MIRRLTRSLWSHRDAHGPWIPRQRLLRQHFVRIIFERLRFRQIGERLLDHRVPVRPNAQSLQLPKLDSHNFVLDAGLQPIHHAGQVGIGPLDILAGQVALEVGQHRIVHLEVLVYCVVGHINGSEVEEDVLVEQLVLEVVALGALDFFVGSNAAAAVDRAARVGELDFEIGRIVGLGAGVVVVVVVKRDAFIVALDEPARGRVVVIGGQRQPRIVGVL